LLKDIFNGQGKKGLPGMAAFIEVLQQLRNEQQEVRRGGWLREGV
jgi:hypothetical protein